MMQTTPSFEIRQGTWNDLGRMAGALRTAVFVREQGVPPELEMDVLDPLCLHVLALGADGQAVATGRLVTEAPGIARIGRMAVRQSVRGQGVGRLVLHALLNAAQQRGGPRSGAKRPVACPGVLYPGGVCGRGRCVRRCGHPPHHHAQKIARLEREHVLKYRPARGRAGAAAPGPPRWLAVLALRPWFG